MIKNMRAILYAVSLGMLFLAFGSCAKNDPHSVKIKEQNKLRSKVKIELRAAHTAYNVQRYDLAIPEFETVINKGWTDGIDLYQYADCLERLGKTDESKVYFQKAYNELVEFYPNHAYIHTLQSQNYGNE